MHLFYYDEVKYDPPEQPSFWLGGISFPSELIPEIEEEVNAVAEKAFGSRLLNRETEFHGIELCRGKGNFRGREFAERMELLEQLLSIVGREDIYRVCIRINPGNITHSPDEPSEIAFMFLVEAVESLFASEDTLGMMFGDYDEPQIGSSVATLSQFRKGGTRWALAKEIKRIIDTVHFAKSHHSRLIQLADIFLYCSQFYSQKNESNWRKVIADKIRKSGILRCSRSKAWPQEARWYR